MGPMPCLAVIGPLRQQTLLKYSAAPPHSEIVTCQNSNDDYNVHTAVGRWRRHGAVGRWQRGRSGRPVAAREALWPEYQGGARANPPVMAPVLFCMSPHRYGEEPKYTVPPKYTVALEASRLEASNGLLTRVVHGAV